MTEDNKGRGGDGVEAEAGERAAQSRQESKNKRERKENHNEKLF